jgi:pyruvate/2-oxoacid:ferredoxin oxidoreductase beta subunit
VNIRELALDGERLASGHRLCPGCGLSIIARAVMRGTKYPIVVACATGCLEVSTTIYPYTAWNVSWIHNAFENAAATISGVEAAYNVLKKKGKINKEIKFLAFGGDGGTYDIGLQSLSGALERGHDFVYVCVDNEGYMNCLSLDSLIMTEHGLKRITEIKEDDMIYAFNQQDGSLVLKRCTGVFDNGIKEVFELNTLHHTIKATSNHPFLIVKRNGKAGKNTLVWKKLEELKQGDEIITLKKQPNKEKYLSQIKQRDYFADNDWFSSEKIISIKLVKEEPTLDLRVEGEHNFIADGIVVHNTGIQRSSSTPYGAWTNTSAVGKLHQGKEQFKKDLTAVVAAHHIPYVAQASPHNYMDLLRKSEKAFNTKGPAFINVLSPCVPGWKYPMHLSVKMAKLAVDTCFWPLFEIENDKWTLNYDPGPNKKPMIEWLKTQGRFRHLLKPENAHIIETIQKNVDERWEQLKKLCGK